MSLQRPNILRMRGYSFGEQPSSKLVTKLNTNENPYPPSPQVAEALASIDPSILNRYPNPVANAFRETAACLHDLHVDNIIPTNGGDELLRLIVTTYVDPTETLATTAPAYSLYPVLAATQNCNFVEIPLTTSWNLPENLGTLLNKNKVKAFFLINPHAPTGQLFSSEQIERVASEFDGLLVIDEAYVDFGTESSVYLINKYDNLIVTQSLSKSRSLAGMRIGCAFASKSIVEGLNRIKNSFNSYPLDRLAQIAGAEAFSDKDYFRQTTNKVIEARQFLVEEMSNLGFQILLSGANFIFTKHNNKRAEIIFKELRNNDILIRFFESQEEINNYLRITVGSMEQMKQLVHVIKKII